MNKALITIFTFLAKTVGGGLVGAFSSLFSVVKQGFNMTMQFHQQSIDTARQIGMTSAQAHAYSQVLAKDATELGIKYGIAADAVKKITENLSNAIGRNVFLNQQQREAIVQMNKLVGEQTTSDFMTQMVSGMGAQIDSVNGAVAKTYATAMKQGLNVQKMSAKVAQNLQLANKLSFRDGVNGIIKMAALSEKVGANLQSLAGAAERFRDLDQAIENAAKMQMLGGSAAMYGGNPLTMAYEANYDPEAFMERMTKTLGGYATFDEKSGMGRVNGLSMDFVRQIAQNLGMSTEEAVTIAKRQAEAKYKEGRFGAAINSVAGGNENMRNFILNTSQVSGNSLVMKDSKGNLQDISYFQKTAEGQKELKAMMDLQAMDEKQLLEKQAQELTSINERIEGFETSLVGLFAQLFQPWIPSLQNFVEKGAYSLLDVTNGIIEKDIKPAIPQIQSAISRAVDTLAVIGKFIASPLYSTAKFLSEHWYALLATIAAIKIGSMTNGVGGGTVGGNVSIGSNFRKQGATFIKDSYQGVKAFGLKGGLKYGWANAGNAFKGVVKGGGIAGLGGMLVNGATNLAANNGLIEKGGTAQKIGNTLGTAAEWGALGATLGSIIPGIGTVVGASVGGIAGAIKGYIDASQKKTEDAIASAATPTAKVNNNFSEGGVVEGSSYDGDRLRANVNSGEMIINRSDQSKLFNILKAKFGLLNGASRTSGLAMDAIRLSSTLSPIGSAINLLAKNMLRQLASPTSNSNNGYNAQWKSSEEVQHSAANPKGTVIQMVASPTNKSNVLRLVSVESMQQGVVGGNGVQAQVAVESANGSNTNSVVGYEVVQQGSRNTAPQMTASPTSSVNVSRIVAYEPMQQGAVDGKGVQTQVVAKPVGEKEYIYTPTSSRSGNVGGNEVTVKDFNVNINGSIRLDGGSSSRNIDVNELLRDQSFVASLKDIIKNSINEDMNGGRLNQDIATRRGGVSPKTIWG